VEGLDLNAGTDSLTTFREQRRAGILAKLALAAFEIRTPGSRRGGRRRMLATLPQNRNGSSLSISNEPPGARHEARSPARATVRQSV
jgi:hypothetical protein